MGIEGASLYATIGVDIGRAVSNLSNVGSEFDRVVASADRAERAANDFGVEANEWASDFGRVAEEAADASLKIDRLARRREMPTAEADRLRATLDRLGAEADQAGAEMAELARQGKAIDPARSAELAKQINRVEGELREATAQADKFDRELESAHRNGGMFNGVIGKMGPLLGALGFAGVTYGIVNMVRSMVGGASEMEKFRVQFEVLLGSAEAANARIAELAEFGKTTPFELPEVVRASRTLEVFTKGALAAGDGLRLVGDVAAGTGMPFEDVAMWVGRMYDALQSGRPFGEATMRLQEMGAIGGESRQRIEELAAGVKSGAMTMEEAWAGVAGEFMRFDGMMERQSKTIEGQWSNLMDTIGMGLTRWGQQLMPLINRLVPAMIDGLGGLLEAGLPVMTFVGERLVGAFESLDTVLTAVAGVALVKMMSGLDAAAIKAKALGIALRGLATAAILFLPEIEDGATAFQRWAAELVHGKEAVDEMAGALDRLGGNTNASMVWQTWGRENSISIERFAQAVEDAGGDIHLAIANIEAGLDPMAQAWSRNMDEGERAAAAFARNSADAIQTELVDELDRQMQDIDDSFGRFVTSVAETPEGIAAVLADGTTVVGDSAEDLAAKVSAAFQQAQADSVAAMKQMMGDIADVMSEDEINKLIEEQADAVANEWSDLGRRALIEATLASENFRAGLTSEDMDVRQDTIKKIDALIAQYEAMAPGALAAGELVNPALLEGILSNMGLAEDEIMRMAEALGLNLDISDAAEGYGAGNIASYADGIEQMESEAERRAMGVASQVRFQLDFDASSGGRSVVASWLRGMGDWYWSNGVAKISGITGHAARYFGRSLPTEGPLKGGPVSGGLSIAESWINAIVAGIDAGMGQLEGGVGRVGAALMAEGGVGVGVSSPRDFGSLAATGGAGGELHLHTELTVMGDIKADDEASVEDALLRASRFAAAEIVNY